MNSNDSSIFLHKAKILEKIKLHQVVAIVGQTGCGKSTQVPKYMYESGLSRNGIIACLHPRCIAAMTLAERVAHETKTRIGELVGYRVRFHTCCSQFTKIIYMTTGYMLRILQDDEAISKFSVVIIDEAHERSIQNDIMMARMKIIMRSNKYVKLVIMSATLNEVEIKKYYPDSAIVRIKKFKDPVEVIYRPLTDKKYIVAVKDIVKEILDSTKSGHILIFLPSEEKVRKCKRTLKDLKKPVVLSFYSAMDYQDKMMVFREYGSKRKVIVATNIAETSLTIEGVDFVIDTGYVKRVQYDHENRVEKWVTEPISVAEANQRKGRTGRTGKGKCYRLYASEQMSADNILEGATLKLPALPSRPAFPTPEILNINLGTTILMLKSIEIEHIHEFPFIVKPDTKNTEHSIAHLKELSLLSQAGVITKLGSEVAYLPLDYAMGKVVVISSQLSCHREVLIIAALLSVINIFKNPTGRESQSNHEKFNSPHGDLFKLLNVYEEASKNRFSKEWCNKNFINHSCLKYARMVEYQLNSLVPFAQKRDADLSRNKENHVKKAFISGFFNNIAHKDGESYKTCSDKTVSLHLGTCVEQTDVVMGTIMLTSASNKDLVLRNCINLNPDMLKAFVPEKYKVKSTIWKEILKKVTTQQQS